MPPIPNIIKYAFGPSASKKLTVNEHEVDLYAVTCTVALLKVKRPGRITYMI